MTDVRFGANNLELCEINMPEQDQQFKRHIAYKLRIGDILIGKPILDGERFSFLELGDKKIIRVNVIGNIVEKYDSEGETKFTSFTLDDGSGLLLGTSQWLTANGRLIRKQGIEPDVTVELPMGANPLPPSEVEDLTVAEPSASEDVQLLKALELLNASPNN